MAHSISDITMFVYVFVENIVESSFDLPTIINIR